VALALVAPTTVHAAAFTETDIFFELNAIDRDIGVHVSLDGESWKALRIEGPGRRTILEVTPRGNVGDIGLTELFFEGEEPSLEEVPFAEFLEKVPAGRYRFLGTTVEGEPLRSVDPLTTALPCPVILLSPAVGQAVDPDEAVVRWQAAPGLFDPDRQRCGPGQVDLVGYEVIVEFANEARRIARSFSITLPPGATHVEVPGNFLQEGAKYPSTVFKAEVAAIEDTGNRTLVERTFSVRP
jgi:hypothetical protein